MIPGQRNDDTARCDFCNRELATPRESIDFECRELPRGRHDQAAVRFLAGHWGACPQCAPLVRRRRWRALADRALDVAFLADPSLRASEHLVRGELVALWLALEPQLTGVERSPATQVTT